MFTFYYFCRLLVELLISFPKVLVAAVNGQALGFGASLLGLCDVVYAHSKVSLKFSPNLEANLEENFG